MLGYVVQIVAMHSFPMSILHVDLAANLVGSNYPYVPCCWLFHPSVVGHREIDTTRTSAG
jgi:hypothetical protein